MPLANYGVLSGQLIGHRRDPPDAQGRWFHIHMDVSAAGGKYDCAVDVDSHASNTGVEWRVIPIQARDIQAIVSLLPGYHQLANTSTSGAIDYVRSSWFRVRAGCVFVVMPDALLQFLLALLGRR